MLSIKTGSHLEVWLFLKGSLIPEGIAALPGGRTAQRGCIECCTVQVKNVTT